MKIPQAKQTNPYEVLWIFLEQRGVSPQSTHQIVRAVWLAAAHSVRDLRAQNELKSAIEEVSEKFEL